MRKIYIQVSHGVNIPKEEDPRKYLLAGQKYEVNDTPYYRRRIGDGDAFLQNPADFEGSKKPAKQKV